MHLLSCLFVCMLLVLQLSISSLEIEKCNAEQAFPIFVCFVFAFAILSVCLFVCLLVFTRNRHDDQDE